VCGVVRRSTERDRTEHGLRGDRVYCGSRGARVSRHARRTSPLTPSAAVASRGPTVATGTPWSVGQTTTSLACAAHGPGAPPFAPRGEEGSLRPRQYQSGCGWSVGLFGLCLGGASPRSRLRVSTGGGGISSASSLITSPWTPPANCCMGCAGGGAKRSAVPPPPPPSVADGAGGAAPSGPLLRSVRWELQGEALVARPRVSLDPRATSGEDDTGAWEWILSVDRDARIGALPAPSSEAMDAERAPRAPAAGDARCGEPQVPPRAVAWANAAMLVDDGTRLFHSRLPPTSGSDEALPPSAGPWPLHSTSERRSRATFSRNWLGVRLPPCASALLASSPAEPRRRGSSDGKCGSTPRACGRGLGSATAATAASGGGAPTNGAVAAGEAGGGGMAAAAAAAETAAAAAVRTADGTHGGTGGAAEAAAVQGDVEAEAAAVQGGVEAEAAAGESSGRSGVAAAESGSAGAGGGSCGGLGGGLGGG